MDGFCLFLDLQEDTQNSDGEAALTGETPSHRTGYPLEVLNYFLGTNKYFESVFPRENVSAVSMSSAEGRGRHHHVAQSENRLVSFPSGGLMAFPSTTQCQCGIEVHPKCDPFPAGKLTVFQCCSLCLALGFAESWVSPVQSPEQVSILVVWLACPSPQHTWESSYHVYGDSGAGQHACFKVWEVRRACLLLTALIQAVLGFPSARDFCGSCVGNS